MPDDNYANGWPAKTPKALVVSIGQFFFLLPRVFDSNASQGTTPVLTLHPEVEVEVGVQAGLEVGSS